MAPAFEKRKGFIVRFNWQGNEEAWLSVTSLHSGLWCSVHELEEKGGLQKPWRGRYPGQGFGACPFVVRLGSVALEPDLPCPVDPALLTGFWSHLALSFRGGGEALVLGVT